MRVDVTRKSRTQTLHTLEPGEYFILPGFDHVYMREKDDRSGNVPVKELKETGGQPLGMTPGTQVIRVFLTGISAIEAQ